MNEPTPLEMLEEIISTVKESEKQAHSTGRPMTAAVHPDSALMRKAQRVVNKQITENMTANELAVYVGDYLKDLAGDCPEEAAKIFEHVFDTATVLVEDNGTFTVDMDGKTD